MSQPVARLGRAIAIRLAIARYVLRRLLPPFLGVVVYTLLATVVVRRDLARHGAALGDFHSTAYAVWTQLFFEPTAPFPDSTVSRLVFWITPMVGLVLVAQGLFKVGAEILDRDARRELWVSLMSEHMRDHVVVCGLGHIGYRVVEELHRLGSELVAVERNGGAIFVETVRALGVPVHVGDARRDDLLAATGVANAKAIVCATNDDLANLEIAIDAKRMNPSIRVVMRMFDQGMAAKVGLALELDTSFSTSAVAAPLIALQATERGVVSAYRVGQTIRVTAEVTVGAQGDGKTVAELEELVACRLVSKLSEGSAIAVRARDRVSRSDTLIVDAEPKDLATIRARLA